MAIWTLVMASIPFLKGHQPVWAGSPGGVVMKNPPTNPRDIRDEYLISGLGRSPGTGNDNPLQYPCLENSMDGGDLRVTLHGVTKSHTRLSEHTHKQSGQ